MCNTFSSRDWIANFRVSRETFLYLCSKLKNSIKKRNTRLRKAVPLKKCVVITLWVLATPSEYRSVAHLFGVAMYSVHVDAQCVSLYM